MGVREAEGGGEGEVCAFEGFGEGTSKAPASLGCLGNV